jgi:hypothetical protein
MQTRNKAKEFQRKIFAKRKNKKIRENLKNFALSLGKSLEGGGEERLPLIRTK